MIFIVPVTCVGIRWISNNSSLIKPAKNGSPLRNITTLNKINVSQGTFSFEQSTQATGKSVSPLVWKSYCLDRIYILYLHLWSQQLRETIKGKKVLDSQNLMHNFKNHILSQNRIVVWNREIVGDRGTYVTWYDHKQNAGLLSMGNSREYNLNQ